MAKVALNKSSLAQQRNQLKLFQKFLPSLDLKRQQLLTEQKKAQEELAQAETEITQLTEKIDEVLQTIPPALRELFIWRHINDLSYEEMAEIKGLPVGTVKNRVFQAKELIRKQLEESI